ncbi:MAG: serine hydrolase [Planctomycetes bacterium]|nr:serine hydrolase [Planctomycetota bacterium]
MIRRPLFAVAALLFAAWTAVAQSPLTAERVAELVATAGERFGVKGLAVSVVQNGEVLAETAYGERADGLPMTPATLCNIASCSKAFTAAAVALLVQEKKLDWDDLVVEHVPEFRMQDAWITEHMTVRDLLCHRCGLVTFAGDLLWYGSDYDDREVLRRMAKLPIVQRFREQFGYQNLMYMVAGLVVEKVSGQSWEDFVTERLLRPLHMETSRTSAQRLPAEAERATPHIDGVAVVDHEFVACKPAASIYSSVHELTAWMRMLVAGGRLGDQQLLSTESLLQMWRPHTALNTAGSGPDVADFRSYGMGWFLSLDHGNKVVEHDGGMPGFLSKVSLMPADGFAFAVLNNGNDGVVNEALKRALYAEHAGEDGMAMVERLAVIKKRIDGRHAAEVAAREAKHREGTSPSHPLADYAGKYEDEIYGPAAIELENGALHVVLLPSKRRLFGAMRHWHDDTFRVDFPDRFLPFALVTFDFTAGGDVAGFKVECPIADFDFGALDFRRGD